MKTTSFLVALLCLSISIQAQNIWVVNDDPQRAPEHYGTFQEAHDTASSGDIIYVIGNQIFSANYGTIIISKPLTVVGSGGLLNYAPDSLTINDKISRFLQVFIDSTADGTSLYGLSIQLVYLGADDLVINGCQASFSHIRNHSGNGQTALNNITIERCFVSGLNLNSYAQHISNLLFRNNILYSGVFNGSSTQLPWVIDHNTFIRSSINIYNSVVGSNIFAKNIGHDYSAQLRGNSFNNNIAVDGHIPSGSGNLINEICDSIFIDQTPFSFYKLCGATSILEDNQVELSNTSPALGTGENGTDIGCTDGSNPYVFGGFPPYPIINKYNIQGVSTNNTLNVEIKVSAQN